MGGLAKLAVDSFGTGAQWFPDAQALAAGLTQALAAAAGAAVPGSTSAAGPAPRAGLLPAAIPRVLIKGSRVNRLERVVDVLVHGSIQPTGGH